jgi:hypothetical protein
MLRCVLTHGVQLTEDDYPALDSITGAVNLLTTRAPALG